MDEIVRLLLKRDESALTQMKTQYGGLCRHIIASLLTSVQDTEEALSDVWLNVWNSIPPAKPKHLRAYLAKAARNTALHYIERDHAQKRSGLTAVLDELAECIPDEAASHEMDALFLRDTLNTFVRSLRREERSLFVRRYYFSQSIKDIATAHHCTENRVTVTLHRLRARLRAFLQKEGYDL